MSVVQALGALAAQDPTGFLCPGTLRWSSANRVVTGFASSHTYIPLALDVLEIEKCIIYGYEFCANHEY